MKTKTYILEIEALDGEERTISITDRNLEACSVFAVVAIGGDGATIVDNGYRSREEAKAAWPEAICSKKG